MYTVHPCQLTCTHQCGGMQVLSAEVLLPDPRSAYPAACSQQQLQHAEGAGSSEWGVKGQLICVGASLTLPPNVPYTENANGKVGQRSAEFSKAVFAPLSTSLRVMHGIEHPFIGNNLTKDIFGHYLAKHASRTCQ